MPRGDKPTTVALALKDGWVYEDTLPEMTKEQYDWWYRESLVLDGVRMGPPLTTHNTPDSKQEALEPCDFCGARSRRYDDSYQIIHHAATCYWSLLKFNPQYVHVSNFTTWNMRSRASIAAVEGDAEDRAKAIVELVENLRLQHVKRKHHGPFESCTSYSICALANRISVAAASSPAPAEPPLDDDPNHKHYNIPITMSGEGAEVYQGLESQCPICKRQGSLPAEPLQPPRCPKCGYVMCQQFDSRPVNALADIAIPNGKYVCYHCTDAAATPPDTPSDAAMRAAKELADKLFQHGTTLTPTVKGDPIGIGYSPRYFIDKAAAIITRHLASPVVATGDDEGDARTVRLQAQLEGVMNSLAISQQEVERLRAGNFTPEEFQNLCHNLDESDKEAFIAGCVEYQKKLFGSPSIPVSENEKCICGHSRWDHWGWGNFACVHGDCTKFVAAALRTPENQ